MRKILAKQHVLTMLTVVMLFLPMTASAVDGDGSANRCVVGLGEVFSVDQAVEREILGVRGGNNGLEYFIANEEYTWAPCTEGTDQIESEQSTVPIGAGEPTATVEPVEPTASVEAGEPTATVEPVEPTASVEAGGPTASVETDESTASVESVEPTASVEPADLVDPSATAPLESTEPVQSSEPTLPDGWQVDEYDDGTVVFCDSGVTRSASPHSMASYGVIVSQDANRAPFLDWTRAAPGVTPGKCSPNDPVPPFYELPSGPFQWFEIVDLTDWSGEYLEFCFDGVTYYMTRSEAIEFGALVPNAAEGYLEINEDGGFSIGSCLGWEGVNLTFCHQETLYHMSVTEAISLGAFELDERGNPALVWEGAFLGPCSSEGSDNAGVIRHAFDGYPNTYTSNFGGAICHQGTTIVIGMEEAFTAGYVREFSFPVPKISFFGLVHEGDTWGPCTEIPLPEIVSFCNLATGETQALPLEQGALEGFWYLVTNDRRTVGYEFIDGMATDAPCPTMPDSDGDGVSDVSDTCPDTAQGVQVDANGCEVAVVLPDTDGDGVSDVSDTCPDTAQGVQVDANGCEVAVVLPDTDGDGVSDVSDTCPDTAQGVQVDANGCEVAVVLPDTDGDGVPDASDTCPDTAQGVQVDVNGCEVAVVLPDTDGDGVSDVSDTCPDTAQGVQVDANGCEVAVVLPDTDGDGVPDASDTCPDTAQGVQVDVNGCEVAVVLPDTDGDGVPDASDTCPDTAQGVQVDVNGCEVAVVLPDTDGDGVLDRDDLCPGTSVGVEVDETGCHNVGTQPPGSGPVVPGDGPVSPTAPGNQDAGVGGSGSGGNGNAGGAMQIASAQGAQAPSSVAAATTDTSAVVRMPAAGVGPTTVSDTSTRSVFAAMFGLGVLGLLLTFGMRRRIP